MTYIKRLVMKGFKSFARETVINLDPNMNVIVGPNGSGKSNITDALCFVLGRLSIKSIRAAKSSHLIFSGNKFYKPTNFAYVEIALDNADRSFALDTNEIVLRRMVNKTGQSTYKINDEVRTRQEVLELLSQAGIDPHGFNIVLQGEIMQFVKMGGEDRRKIIEEVAGISVYEMRKEKSLKELEKTNEKLRQVSAILRERTNYLKNLENEREEALRFQKLQETVRRCRGSIIAKSSQEKEKQLTEVLKKIEVKEKEAAKVEEHVKELHKNIEELHGKIEGISKTIQKSAGVEQDTLLEEISLLKQEYAGMMARKENFESKLVELDRRKKALDDGLAGAQKEIEEMMKEQGKDTKKDLEVKKKKLEEYEEAKRKYYLLKSNISSLAVQIEDKKRQIYTLKHESQLLLGHIEQTERDIPIKEKIEVQGKKLVELKENIEKHKKEMQECQTAIIEMEKEMAVARQVVTDAEGIKGQVSKLDVCPLCQTNITADHKHHVFESSNEKIARAQQNILRAEKNIESSKQKMLDLRKEIEGAEEGVSARKISIVKIQTIIEKKEQLHRNEEKIVQLEDEVKKSEVKKKAFDDEFSIIKINETSYETLKLEINEIQRSQERNVGFEITSKQREVDRMQLAIKQIIRDRAEIEEDIIAMKTTVAEKNILIDAKEKQADILKKKYNGMYEERNSLQDTVRRIESTMLNRQNDKRMLENDVNNFKIEKAQVNAKIDTHKEELKEFEGIELINLPVDKLREKLVHAEEVLSHIGNVNMRALEVYDSIKEEYEKIREKVTLLEKEQEEIMRVIEQIDRKKKKTFVHTLEKINELFSQNFSALSEKGVVTLEAQNEADIFAGGLDIIVKVGGGKHFDVTSLSGGEQSLVALSLIFAIQDLNPYCFYIFDEIDAALDRRNSEKIAHLFKRHMKKGQYLIITHNDSIISESTNILYGVSMQEGISKVLSLEI